MCVAPVRFLLIMAYAALFYNYVEREVDEHPAVVFGLSVTGACACSSLLWSLILLWYQSAGKEDECTTRRHSSGAIVWICLFSTVLHAGSSLVCFMDAVWDMKEATALGGGVLRIAGSSSSLLC